MARSSNGWSPSPTSTESTTSPNCGRARRPDRCPGALWRLYLIQLMIHDDPHTAALLYERGRVELTSADPVVAGAPDTRRTGRTRRPHRHDPARALPGRLRGRARPRRRVLPCAGIRCQSSRRRLRGDRARARLGAHDPRAAPRGLRVRPHCLRGAVAARVADLSRAPRGRKWCRAAERLSARSRSQRQKMEPGVTAARLFQCNRGLGAGIPVISRR